MQENTEVRIDKDIIKVIKNDSSAIIMESPCVYFDKRINGEVNKTTIAVELNETDFPGTKDSVEEILRTKYEDIEKIVLNGDTVEENISKEFKVLTSSVSNLNIIFNKIEKNKKFLIMVLEFSNVSGD